MSENYGRSRWFVLAGVLLLTVVIGALAYNAGMADGLTESAVASGAPTPYAYGWHRPWGFGFGFPLFFLVFWILLFRGFWWGGGWHRRRYWDGPYGFYPARPDSPQAFDDWHRAAHERMKEPPSADDPGRGR